MKLVPINTIPALVLTSEDYVERFEKLRLHDAPPMQRDDDPTKFIPLDAAFLLYLMVDALVRNTIPYSVSERDQKLVVEHLDGLYFELDFKLYEVVAVMTDFPGDEDRPRFRLLHVPQGGRYVSISELVARHAIPGCIARSQEVKANALAESRTTIWKQEQADKEIAKELRARFPAGLLQNFSNLDYVLRKLFELGIGFAGAFVGFEHGDIATREDAHVLLAELTEAWSGIVKMEIQKEDENAIYLLFSIASK